MKKVMSLAVTGLLVLSAGAMSFADTLQSPAEIYADEAGITVEEAYAARGAGERFGDLAKENGYWDAFKAQFLGVKEDKIQALVDSGDMTQEEADEILSAMEACDGTDPARLLQGMNMGFGRNSGGNAGNGFGAQGGYGLKDGSGAQNGNGLRDGSGAGRGGRWNQE